MASRKTRRLLRILGGTILVLVTLGALAIKVGLPIFIHRYFLAQLRAAGIEQANLVVQRIGWKQALLSNVRIGKEKDLLIQEVSAEYSLTSILHGRLDVIAVTGLRINARLGTRGISFGALDKLFDSAGQGGGPPPALPATVFEIRSSRLDVATPLGKATIPLSVTANLGKSGRLDLKAEIGLQSPNATLSTEAAVELEPDGRAKGSVRIARGSISFGTLVVGSVAGTVLFEGSGFKIETLDGRVSLGELKMPSISFPAANFEFGLVKNRVRAKVEATSSDSKSRIWLFSRVDDIYGPTASMSLQGAVEAQTAFWLQWLSSHSGSVKGRGRVAFEIEGTLPNPQQLPTPAKGFERLQTATLAGKIDLDATDVSVPHVLDGLSGDGQLNVGLSEGVLTIGSPKGLHFQAKQLDWVLLPKWAREANLQRNLKGPLSLQIGDGNLMPFTLRARGSGETVSFRGKGEALLKFQDGIRLRSTIEVTAELSEQRRIKRFSMPHLALDLLNWRQGTAKIDLRVRNASFSGTPESFSGDFNLGLSARHVRGEKLDVQGVDLTLGGDIDFQNRRLAVRPKKGSFVRVTGAHWLEPAAKLAPLTLQIERGARPMVEADLKDPLSPALRHEILLSPSLLKLDALLSPNQPLSLKARVPRVRLNGGIWGSQGKYQGEMDVTGVDLEVPSQFIALRGLDAKLRYDLLSSTREGTASINVREILDLRNPPSIKILRLTSDIKLLKERLVFSGQVGESNGALVVDFNGRENLASGQGSAAFKLHPVSFIPQGNQPQDLFPFLRGTVKSASGKVAMQGTLRWTPRKVTPNLNLLVEDLSFQVNGVKVERINSAIKIDGLWPPSTPAGQIISIALINPGLPLTDAVCSFRFDPSGGIFVERAHVGLAGGKIRADGVIVDPKKPENGFTLGVDGVDMERLVSLAKIEGLKATGRLKGKIPLLVKGRALIVEEGLLEGPTEGGVIQYNPLEIPPALRYGGEKTKMMLTALRNFRYESLNIRLNGRSDGESVVAFHLRGSNPEFFKGRPVEFNLNVSGPLSQILQRSMNLYQIPAKLRKRLGQ